MKIIRITAIFVALVAVGSALTKTTLDAAQAKSTNSAFQDRDPQKPLQHTVASKTAKFAAVDRDDSLPAGRSGANSGTPRPGTGSILQTGVGPTGPCQGEGGSRPATVSESFHHAAR